MLNGKVKDPLQRIDDLSGDLLRPLGEQTKRRDRHGRCDEQVETVEQAGDLLAQRQLAQRVRKRWPRRSTGV